MREIKFRGKALFHNDEMIYGTLVLRPFKGTYKAWIENTDVSLRVDPETVGQFTGLLDANGREIYEGDIIRDVRYPQSKGTVTFGKVGYDSSWNGMTGFLIAERQTDYGWGDGEFMELQYDDDYAKVEVIGNIHEKEGD